VRIKLDENLGRPHIALLKRHGYEADRVFDQGLSGIEDADLWVRVRRDGQFLITLDLGFSDVRRYAPGTHPGILLVRPRRKGRNAVSNVLRRVLNGAAA
jgi:predicted nuclease of predicted toxin-antitoxin system